MQHWSPAKVPPQRRVIFISQVIDCDCEVPGFTAWDVGDLGIHDPITVLFQQVIHVMEIVTCVVVHGEPI